jgi:hypothetical protein
MLSNLPVYSYSRRILSRYCALSVCCVVFCCVLYCGVAKCTVLYSMIELLRRNDSVI